MSILRINHNVSAVNSLRRLTETDRKLAESLERLSSGFRINKAADSPSGLVISEQLRGQISGLNQAIANAEIATSMVQTTEGALTEVNNLLIRMRGLALHAANEGANDEQALEADQLEISNALDTMQRIATTAQFGKKKLLDGSTGVTGTAQGEGLTFLEATEQTRTSPIQGYVVQVDQVATRPFLQGETAVTEGNVGDLTVTLEEGGRTVKVSGNPGETPDAFFGRLQGDVAKAALPLMVEMSEDGILRITHEEYGSEATFRAASSVAGVLSPQAGRATEAVPGQDIQGTIGGEAAYGRARTLTGGIGNENTEGLTVRYTGPSVTVVGADGVPRQELRPQAGAVGTVNVANNALNFQIGPNRGQDVEVALPATSPVQMARSVETESGFRNLSEIDVRSAQGARDALALIDAAVDEMTLTRGKLGAFQRNSLERNIATLQVTLENLIAAESAIRDVDVAEEIARFTKNRLLLQSNTAALAQANNLPRTVVSLLEST